MITRVGRHPDPAVRIRKRQGETIRRLRTMRDLTIAEFAAKVGVTQGAVSQWETGRFSPRQAIQLRIAQVLDVDWSTIFGLDEVA